ncbi:amidohydrolase family protein [Desulfogranum japonicum]|uniref:amidohydrolase family protein n=1 Tax=Desulfogranum japonicum TaxID=231447 RepID=UPI0003F504F7|nr:amidohydrolase [Desulfogranum japonicum]
MASQSVDLIVTGRYLLTMDAQATVIENAALVIDQGKIIDLGKREELLLQYQATRLLKEEHGLIMPGLVNVHTHAAMACFRGLADDLPLMEWLQDYIFPVEAALTGNMVYTSSLLSMCEMIKSGTTSFCDMYLFAGEVGRAAEKAGMRSWIGEVLYDFPSPNYGDLENGFIYTDELLQQYSGHDLITVTIDPHSVYTCSPDLLRRLGKLAEKNDALYNIHLSENDDEVRTCKERYGCSPVEHLEKLGLLQGNVLAAHCVKVTPSEIARMAEKGVAVAHCPESNMKLASGFAPVGDMIENGLTVGIGTDGAASNNDVDMFGEMNTVAKIHKMARLDPTAMDAYTTLYAATMGGAKALHADRAIGSLEKGKQADCIILDLNQPHLTPLYSPISHLVYAARGSDVLHSVIQGKVVMENRKVQTLDERELLEKMQLMGREIRKLRKAG